MTTGRITTRSPALNAALGFGLALSLASCAGSASTVQDGSSGATAAGDGVDRLGPFQLGM